jgi:hypothetical protein
MPNQIADRLERKAQESGYTVSRYLVELVQRDLSRGLTEGESSPSQRAT